MKWLPRHGTVIAKKIAMKKLSIDLNKFTRGRVFAHLKFQLIYEISLGPSHSHADGACANERANQFAKRRAGRLPLRPTAAAPVWGKLVMAGNVVTVITHGAATPTAWIQLGKPQTLGFVNNPVLVGIYIASHNAAAISTGTIDKLFHHAHPSLSACRWRHRLARAHGIGQPHQQCRNLSGSGADIWGTSDQFNFPALAGLGDCTSSAA